MQKTIHATLVATALILGGVSSVAWASHVSYDPYADAVDSSAGEVARSGNATGTPDGKSAALEGNASITLDMGAGEEGTASLKVCYSSGLAEATRFRVTFFDDDRREITSATSPTIVSIGSGSESFEYSFNQFSRAYRYIRIVALSGTGINIDAIEAASYVGISSSIDTDGDGRSDRDENEAGTDPTVADPPPPPPPSPTPDTQAPIIYNVAAVHLSPSSQQ